MRLHATEHDLTIMESERLISGSINIYTCEFTFDSSWDGYMVTAVFSTANKVVNAAIVDGKCEIPAEVLRPNSRLRIGVFGNDGVHTRPTTYSEWISVEQGADVKGRTGRPPELTVYEQWMNGISEQVDEWAEADARRVIEKTTATAEYVPAGEAVPAVEKQLNDDGSMNLHFLLSTGVYVGSGAMPDDCNVQIDPMGDVITEEDLGGCRIFVAEYGVTTWADLKAAYDEGKYIVVDKSGYLYGLYMAGNYMEFRQPGTTNVPYCRCLNTSEWKSGNFATTAMPTAHASSHAADGSDPITPESIGAISALGESIADPEVNIDDLVLTKCYLCGATVIKNGLKGDLPFQASHLLKVEDFTGNGRRAIQTAVLNNVSNPKRRWRLWNGYEWSAWQEG